ncbi:cytochrome P450 [Rhodocollybia butyracea]|uniref:Cytochrome P450 n=1 Tax=Rhodocollybia butyracea TaxID=206335 RepID=A0A9P5TYP1_9AGAR|nr:cytochrome P450 [Rhodocollybia butyracea]
MDTKAIQHIMRNDYTYIKPRSTQRILQMVLGEGSGILLSEGARHRRQNPAFGPNQIRELTPAFFEKSFELRDIWAAQITEGVGRVDAMDWFSKTALDIIGLTGFNYHFNGLNGRSQTNELSLAFSAIFRSSGWASAWMPVIAALPIQRVFRAVSIDPMNACAECIQRIGREILTESKAYLAATGEKSSWGARDLLSLLLKSNMSTEIAGEERMSDADVIAQIPTFLIAGFETTSTSLTWAFLALSQHQEIQDKLREELLGVSTATPSMDELNELPLLDAFLRETLRLYAPLIHIMRAAEKDDIIPLAHPITDCDGIVHNELLVRKGQMFNLSLLGVNTDKSLWGPDAGEFRPERWLQLPDSVKSIPGVYSNLMTFFGGSRGCIGWRFALMEMKVLLFTLVRSFEVELEVPKEQIVTSRAAAMQRPSLSSEPIRAILPVIIRPLKD